MIARRYAAEFGYDPRALAKIAADQRTNACAHTRRGLLRQADHHRRRAGQPDGRRSAAPARDRDAVRTAAPPSWSPTRTSPAAAGTGRSGSRASASGSRSRRRPTPADLRPHTDRRRRRGRRSRWPGSRPDEVDMVSVYDCYTITVLMTLEDAGFCAQGQGRRLRQLPRPDLPGRLPVATPTAASCPSARPGWPAECRTSATLPGRSRAASGQNQVADCNTRVRRRQRRHHERAGRPRPAGRLTMGRDEGERRWTSRCPSPDPGLPAVLGRAARAQGPHPVLAVSRPLGLLPAHPGARHARRRPRMARDFRHGHAVHVHRRPLADRAALGRRAAAAPRRHRAGRGPPAHQRAGQRRSPSTSRSACGCGRCSPTCPGRTSHCSDTSRCKPARGQSVKVPAS